MKVTLHYEQLCDFSCVSDSWDLMNLSHNQHICAFTTVWTLKWLLRPPEEVKDLLQWGQLWGFITVWTPVCLMRADSSLKALRHNEQLNSFDPV